MRSNDNAARTRKHAENRKGERINCLGITWERVRLIGRNRRTKEIVRSRNMIQSVPSPRAGKRQRLETRLNGCSLVPGHTVSRPSDDHK
jgi:hypothetical protein